MTARTGSLTFAPVIRSSSPTSARSVTLFTATCMVVANMVGTGVFTSLGYQVPGLPSAFAIMMLWLVGGICALCGALVYGELAAALPRSGGEYNFLSEIYHPSIGFLAGWLSATVGFSVPVALSAMAFSRYFANVWTGAPPLALSIGIVAVVTIVHLRGVRIASAFQDVSTIIKVLLILALIAVGFHLQTPQALTFLPLAGDGGLIASSSFAVSLIYVMYAYGGWNASTYIAGEVRNPARNLPLSVMIGTVLVMVLYLTLNAIFLRAAPMSELAGQMDVAHVAATYIFGTAGSRVMSGLICAGLISSISAMMWIGPRVAMTMGEDFHVLRIFARRTPGGVPAVAMLVQFVIIVLLLATATFEAIVNYVQFSLTLCSFLTVLGVIILRYTRPDLPRPYKTWGYPLTPLIFLGISLWMLCHVLMEKRNESLAGLGTLLAGLILYFLSPTRTRRLDLAG